MFSKAAASNNNDVWTSPTSTTKEGGDTWGYMGIFLIHGLPNSGLRIMANYPDYHAALTEPNYCHCKLGVFVVCTLYSSSTEYM